MDAITVVLNLHIKAILATTARGFSQLVLKPASRKSVSAGDTFKDPYLQSIDFTIHEVFGDSSRGMMEVLKSTPTSYLLNFVETNPSILIFCVQTCIRRHSGYYCR